MKWPESWTDEEVDGVETWTIEQARQAPPLSEDQRAALGAIVAKVLQRNLQAEADARRRRPRRRRAA